MAVPTSIFPVSEAAILVGRELITGTAAPSLVTIPVPSYEPEDLPVWVHDVSLRGSMVLDYDDIQGPVWSEHTFPTSPVYMDTIGYMFHNLFGDYTATGQAAAP